MANAVYLVFLIPFISTTEATVDVQFLRGGPRLNNSLYWDYYFCCNALGYTLQWEVKNDGGLGGFNAGDLGRVLASHRPNFNYTATLLSVQNITQRRSSYSSVLIVSSTRNLSVSVICRNGLTKSSVNNLEEKDSIIGNVSNSNVYLQYLLSQSILDMTVTSNLTKIFICGVNYLHMHWVMDTSNQTYEFSTAGNVVGNSIKHPRESDTVVTQQAILLSFAPYTLVSVFFATANEDVTVTCGYGENELQITSHLFDSIMTQTTSELSESTTSGDILIAATSPGRSLCNPYSEDSILPLIKKQCFGEPTLPMEVIVLPVAIGSGLVIFLGILTSILICVCWRFYKRCTCVCSFGRNPDEEKCSYQISNHT